MTRLTIKQIDYIMDSTVIFEQCLSYNWPCFIDSCQPDSEQGRYDIITAEPFLRITTRGSQTKIKSHEDEQLYHGNPFEHVKAILANYQADNQTLPFCGGAIGYFGYDLCKQLEKLPNCLPNDLDLPDMAIGIYDWALITDHKQQKSYLVSPHFHPSTQQLLADISAKIKIHSTKSSTTAFTLTSPFQASITAAEYEQAFNHIKDYIFAGDCYQVNLTQRFQASYTGTPWQAYQALRRASLSPYSTYLAYPFAEILSCSPERFMQVNNDIVQTKPMKGTRPRSANPTIDSALAAELLQSEKDRAENLMIVDLLRNDLGRGCVPGSIQVDRLFALESFASVHHLVSTIQGKIAKPHHTLDILAHCFPGGSITGAPKIRAMEIIEELEQQRRNVYCGSIGYISFCGNMDMNIAIRTLTCVDNEVYGYAGGAIVADSVMQDEYEECFTKIQPLISCLERM